MKTTIYEDPDQCRFVWEKMWPVKGFFDLWQVRSCFHDAFARPLRFHVVEDKGRAVGFLALCWNEEEQKFIQFPGETWRGKTWLEQNRIVAETPTVLEALLDSIPGSVHLRYLTPTPVLGGSGLLETDEIGYVFFPGLYDFSFEQYQQSFSGKSRKKLRAEIRKLEEHNVCYRYNHYEDVDVLFQLNRESFGEHSYFGDSRFLAAFDRLAGLLDRLGMLRVTTVLMDGRVAAVDLGAVWKNTYTLLAGGASREFPGVAKLINLHHMEWACHRKMDTVDFLCGDFNWKERFHLTPMPLYALSFNRQPIVREADFQKNELVCA